MRVRARLKVFVSATIIVLFISSFVQTKIQRRSQCLGLESMSFFTAALFLKPEKDLIYLCKLNSICTVIPRKNKIVSSFSAKIIEPQHPCCGIATHSGRGQYLKYHSSFAVAIFFLNFGAGFR